MSKELCSKIKNNPYTYGVIDEKSIELKLKLIKEQKNILIYEKRYNDQAGYIFVVCDNIINEEKFRKIYRSYSQFVREVAKGVYKEVELVLIANNIEENVKEIIKALNQSYVERKPIRYKVIG